MEEVSRAVIRNASYSFAMTMVVTRGNWAASAYAALLATVATLVYSVTITLFRRGFFSKEALFCFSWALGTLGGEKSRFKMNFLLTFFATAVPYALRYPSPAIPLFGIVLN